MNREKLFEMVQNGEYLRITNADNAPATLKLSHDRKYIHFCHFGTFACENKIKNFATTLAIVAKSKNLEVVKVSGFYSEN